MVISPEGSASLVAFPERTAAIVLAGGRGSRLGGRDKAALELSGKRLVDRVVDALRARGVPQPIVVGPPTAIPAGCLGVREDPPFTGPLAALAAALPLVEDRTETVLLVSCDLAFPDAALAVLAAEPWSAGEAVVLEDPDGRAQWLAGRYPLAELRDGIAVLGDAIAGGPLRAAFSGLAARFVPVRARTVHDIDTLEDLERARTDPGGPA